MDVTSYFATASAYPPSFQGDGASFAFSVFGMLGTMLLVAEWGWRLAWALVEQPQPLRHPATMMRLIILCLIVGVLMRIAPDTAGAMLWREQSPSEREALAYANRILDGMAIVPTWLAWFGFVFSTSSIDHQLLRRPIPVDLWPTWHRLRRSLLIGLLVLVIAVAVAIR